MEFHSHIINLFIEFVVKHNNFFTFKDKTPVFCLRLKFGGCNANSYGKTKLHFKVIVCQHLGVSALTGKRMKRGNDSAIK